MRRRQAAFTLVELMIAMAIVTLVLYAAINFFIVSVRQYKVQTKITESNVEGILGLELLRQDLESLGFGLPWNNLGTYPERTTGSAALLALNEAANAAPRAVLSVNDAAFTHNNSDYLVIKSARVGMSDAAGKWTTLTQGNDKRAWTPATENLDNTDYVIVLALGSTNANRRSLVDPGTFYTQYNSTAAYVPVEPYSANIVYGIDNASPGLLVRPFNRADYYIDNTAVPQHCAPNTGVLVKAVVAQEPTGSTPTLLPLMDCVADMQIVYGLDTDENPLTPLQWSDVIPGLAADAIRTQLKEVHVHILAQEGQRDDSFTYPGTTVPVGSEGFVNNFNVGAYRNYRWKVYNIIVNPKNLAQ